MMPIWMLAIWSLMLKLKPDSAKKKKRLYNGLIWNWRGGGMLWSQGRPAPDLFYDCPSQQGTLGFCPSHSLSYPHYKKNPPPMQGTSVQQMDSKIPRASGQLSPLITTTEPTCCNYWSLAPRAGAWHQEKPLQWEAHALPRRAAPALSN